MNKTKLLVIAGPTGSGKSKLAIESCLRLVKEGIPAEIISVDSISFYKGFNIGAAKPSLEEQNLVQHHLIDICEPNKEYNAADFVRDCEQKIFELSQKNILPVLVGGSGFYLKALLQGMTEGQNKAGIKEELETRFKAEGIQKLYQEMLQRDPDLAQKIHPNDNYRVIRALEAMISTGKKWSEINEAVKSRPPKYPNCHFFCIQKEREEMKERIWERTRQMLEVGLIEEVKKLVEQGVSIKSKAMLSVGYKECLEYLDLIPAEKEKPNNKHELAVKICRETMRLAKSQMTWFRGQKNVIWLDEELQSNQIFEIFQSGNYLTLDQK